MEGLSSSFVNQLAAPVGWALFVVLCGLTLVVVVAAGVATLHPDPVRRMQGHKVLRDLLGAVRHLVQVLFRGRR